METVSLSLSPEVSTSRQELEWLGDALLEAIAVRLLLSADVGAPVGPTLTLSSLSMLREAMLTNRNLAAAFDSLGLGAHVAVHACDRVVRERALRSVKWRADSVEARAAELRRLLLAPTRPDPSELMMKWHDLFAGP